MDNDWQSISAGGFNSLAIKKNGTLWGWGWNHNGNLGIGNTITQTSPVQVGLENTWKKISVSGTSALAVKNNKTLWGWGQNYYGEIGVGDKLEKDTPVYVNYPNNIAKITTGFGVSAVLDLGLDKICMAGDNNYGELGDSTIVGKAMFECGKFLQSVLAITITSIKAYENNNKIYVSWSVATESNIVRYDVEKSYSGTQFEEIATIYSKGDNNKSANYTWIDQNIRNGSNFYRIKIADQDGNKYYTSISNVRINFDGVGISCSPNPVIDNFINLNIKNLPASIYSINFIDMVGKKYFLKNIQHNGGSTLQTLNIKLLPKGIYYLVVSNNKDKYSAPVIIN